MNQRYKEHEISCRRSPGEDDLQCRLRHIKVMSYQSILHKSIIYSLTRCRLFSICNSDAPQIPSPFKSNNFRPGKRPSRHFIYSIPNFSCPTPLHAPAGPRHHPRGIVGGRGSWATGGGGEGGGKG